MNTPTLTAFAHRENRDGTIDSICRTCFATIATSIRESELGRKEQEHRCDPMALERIRDRGRRQVGNGH